MVAATRTLAVRYAILFPKVKAAAFFQPEDHVSSRHIKNPMQKGSPLFLKASHNASIFGCGAVLFLAQEHALRRLEPESSDSFSAASPSAVAVSGGVGGAAYSLCATTTAAWLGSTNMSLDPSCRAWTFLRRALPYTLSRDSGGFALYFGCYSFAHDALSRGLPMGRDDSSKGMAELDLLTCSLGGISRALAVAATSGGLAGLVTYPWRSHGTRLQAAVGWRPGRAAPARCGASWAAARRESGAIGAVTWSAYEVADAGLRALAGPADGVDDGGEHVGATGASRS